MKPSHNSWEAEPLLPNMAETPYTPLNSSFGFAASYQTTGCDLPKVSRTVEKALNEGKLLDVVYGIKEMVAILSQTPLNIALTGNSGNGLSSFINALRIIGHEEDDSAPTGVVRTTQTPAEYSSPHFPNVVLWDLPGLGATAQTVESYSEEMNFKLYNLFIIIASEQFSSNHVNLAKVIQRMGKRFYIVWTKLDRDLSQCVLSEIRLLQSIQENIQQSLQKERVNIPPIFLVSNLDPLLHDFPKLRDMLHEDLSNIRCCGPLNALSGTCEKIIDDKVACLKERIDNGCWGNSFCVGDNDDMGECLKVFRLEFGVDDESLQQVAQSMRGVVQEYKVDMKSQTLHTLRRRDWKLRLMTCGLMNALFQILKCLPGLCCCTLCSRRMKLKRMLLLVSQDTKTIVKKILKDITSSPQI
ncbi:LOW QUALITY PROTEIN: immunity-related GTPase family M protein 1-like [Peromyscus leucopus]|uniref:LOW QUALITY PROTEIN: immunity-related GTPase family M protein 1-like n=1 Tax=Peromyscus leucopus TaxID=10041 RepID=UPI0010A1C97A|nr:LOW QUALITY PROTEIN: immunity-related GTPase family M protein 1-like [Peromyscus leucopus]